MEAAKYFNGICGLYYAFVACLDQFVLQILFMTKTQFASQGRGECYTRASFVCLSIIPPYTQV